MGSLRLFENQRQQWHKEDSEEFRRQMRDNLRIFADQRRRKEEVQERKALINQCMKRTKEIETESKDLWEKIKEEVKRMNYNEMDKDLKLPMELTELEQIELEEIICNRKTLSENSS